VATVDDVASDIATEFGEEFSDLDIKEQFRTWVSEVFEEVYASGRWFFQNDTQDITLSDGVKDYSMNADVAEVRDMRDPNDNVRVEYVPVERLIARGKDLLLEGTPSNWYIDSIGVNQEIIVSLWPVPDAAATAAITALTAYTLKRPPALGGSDTIPIPREYIRVMKDAIRAKVKFSDGDLDGNQVARQMFQDGLLMLNARFHGKPRQGSTLPVKLKLKQTHQMPAVADGG
jgi:hypothetical protein